MRDKRYKPFEVLHLISAGSASARSFKIRRLGNAPRYRAGLHFANPEDIRYTIPGVDPHKSADDHFFDSARSAQNAA